MTDQPPQPGWWKASDGNWYPPQGGQPMPPQAAKSGCGKAVLIVGGIFVAIFVLGVCSITFLGGSAGTRDDPDGSADGDDGEAGSASAELCDRTYPDKQDRDRCPGDEVRFSGFTASVTGITRTTDPAFDSALVCADVALANRDDKTQRYSEFTFRLQTPAGEVNDITFHSFKPELGSGDLVSGGSKAGKVCWEDPGQPGEHIVIWKPDSFNADRALWFTTL